jgi:ribonuclease Z
MPDELIVLGSSSGVPTKQRFPSAYALRVTGKLFLIDCGAPVSTLLYRYELDPLDVKAVFLSHWHMDHVAGLGMFLTQSHNLKRKNSLRVYGPLGHPQ